VQGTVGSRAGQARLVQAQAVLNAVGALGAAHVQAQRQRHAAVRRGRVQELGVPGRRRLRPRAQAFKGSQGRAPPAGALTLSGTLMPAAKHRASRWSACRWSETCSSMPGLPLSDAQASFPSSTSASKPSPSHAQEAMLFTGCSTPCARSPALHDAACGRAHARRSSSL